MEQIVFFLTEYAEEVLIFFCAFIMILLVVILHRIGNISKMIQDNLLNIRTGQATIEKSQVDKPMLTPAEVEALLSEDEHIREPFEKVSMQPEKLLTEVLDEVFL